MEIKVWGTTRLDECRLPHYSRHILELEANTFCSFHYHLWRGNRFHVHSGRVQIVQSIGWAAQSDILGPGSTLEVPPLVPHQFQVLESGTMVEEYFPNGGDVVRHGVDLDDIVRLTVGGKGEVEERGLAIMGEAVPDGFDLFPMDLYGG